MRTAVQTLPAEQRSRGIAISYSGGSLGAIVTPLIVTPIAVWFGWRGAFWFTGLIGLGWLVLWLLLSRSIPQTHRRSSVHGSLSAFRDRRVWAFMAAYAFGGLPLAFVIYGSAIYLSKALGVPQVTIGKLLWIPPLGWEVGYFFWGWVADRFSNHYRSLLAMSAILSLPLALVVTHRSVGLVMLQLFFAMFIAGAFVIISIAYAARVLPTEQSGLFAGLGAGSWSAVVAVVMPYFGRMFDQQRYAEAFGLAAFLPSIGFFGWWLLSSLRNKTVTQS
jgi:ACS family hexuronate transporter-like MFS transporter